MPQLQNITFVSAVSNREILSSNLLASPCFVTPYSHQILLQEGYRSAAEAYNDAIDRSKNDLMVFMHQDLILPESWLSQLNLALDILDRDDPNWGVLGCYGETRDDGGRGYIYSSGRGILGKPFDQPQRVQTLDEIVLIIRKSSGIRFDQALPHFHMYGADICMKAQKMGRRNYAISAFCIHNTIFNLVLPNEFYESYRHLKRTWREFLPIQTTCVRVTQFDVHMLRRRMQELYLRYIRHKEIAAARLKDGKQLLDTVHEVNRASSADSPSQACQSI
jgi:hypothetical protein